MGDDQNSLLALVEYLKRRCPEMICILASQTDAEFDLGLALLCCGRADVALEEYREAATRTRALRHVGRRANLVRVAQRDLRLAVAGKLVPDAPVLAEIDEILASIPTGRPPEGPGRS